MKIFSQLVRVNKSTSHYMPCHELVHVKMVSSAWQTCDYLTTLETSRLLPHHNL